MPAGCCSSAKFNVRIPNGQGVFCYCALADFTVLVLLTAVWAKNVTEAKNHSLRTKLT